MRRALLACLLPLCGCSTSAQSTDAAAGDPRDLGARPAADLGSAADGTPRDGPGPDAALASAVPGAAAMWLEVDATSLYWVGTHGDPNGTRRLWSIARAVAMQGGAPAALVDLSGDGDNGRVFGLAQDAAALYYFGEHGGRVGSAVTVNRLAKQGGGPAELARFTVPPLAVDLASDGVDLYWLTDDGVVRRTPVAGGPAEVVSQGGLVSLAGHQMVLDGAGHRLYLPTATGIVAIDTVSKAATPVTSQPAGLQLAPIPGGMVFVGGSSGTFWRVLGLQAEDLGIAAHLAVQGLASDGRTLWWFHDGVGAVPADGALSAAPLEVGGAEAVLAQGLESIESYGDSLALDGAGVFFSAAILSDAAPFGDYRIFALPR